VRGLTGWKAHTATGSESSCADRKAPTFDQAKLTAHRKGGADRAASLVRRRTTLFGLLAVTTLLAANASAQTAQTITFAALSDVVLGVSPFGITATATSGLTVSFASNSPTVCTVSGATVTIASVGSCSITASQSGNGTYAAATPVTRAFNVLALPTASTTTLSALPSISNYGQSVALTATVTPSSATGKVTFYDGTTMLGIGALSGGTATATTALPAPGTRALRAYYQGGGTLGASTSANFTEQ